MAGHASTVDDPERHFLGNLLDDDPCFNPPQLGEGHSSSPGAIPPVSVISGVGPISTSGLLRSYWPEPPPPYSPPVQTQWYNSEPPQFYRAPSADFIYTKGHPTFITQPQIHHHHHNLHHHTHTHNVVENHHHYPVATVKVPSHGYGVSVLAETSPNFPNLTGSEEVCVSKENTRKVDGEEGFTHEVIQSSTSSAKKATLSYRDVAARVDQSSGNDGHNASQTKLKLLSDVENRLLVKPRDANNFVNSKPSRANRDRKLKSAAPLEFQKIARKKVAPKKEKVVVNGSASLPLLERSATVDMTTKYEVLQNLSTKSSDKNSASENVFASQKEREPMRTTMAGSNRVRSSSSFSGTGAGKVVNVVDHSKRVVGVVEKKKLSTRTNANAAPLRNRTTRKRMESGWVEKTVSVISRLSGWVEMAFKWILTLVVDVCLQIYDVTSFGVGHLLESLHSSMRRMLLLMHTSFVAGISCAQQIDIRRLLRFSETEQMMWGLQENISLPETGEEALGGFLQLPRCQDAYGVLGLKASCTEEEVQRHYRRLNTLLHPENNMLEGAEEAHELVNKAYQAISTPEARKTYNFTRIQPYKNNLHHEIGELWNRICARIAESRNSMYCVCGRRHTRIPLKIQQNEARYCRRCRTRHAARAMPLCGHSLVMQQMVIDLRSIAIWHITEAVCRVPITESRNDIWVETRMCGLLWIYLTCCDGIVYDITEWATCEVNLLKHVRPNSHTVQYRLVSPPRSVGDMGSNKHDNDKIRDMVVGADETQVDWGRPGHAQISYVPLEPRDEDRSRRAANRRQKRWR